MGAGREISLTRSLDLGASRLVGHFVRHDPMTPAECDHLHEHVAQALEPLRGDTHRFGPRQCVAAGGTVTELKLPEVNRVLLSGQAVTVLRGVLG